MGNGPAAVVPVAILSCSYPFRPAILGLLVDFGSSHFCDVPPIRSGGFWDNLLQTRGHGLGPIGVELAEASVAKMLSGAKTEEPSSVFSGCQQSSSKFTLNTGHLFSSG